MLIAEYDYDTDIAVQRRESLILGIQQGKSEGLIQGFSDGVRQTASALKRMGLAITQIAQATGLSEAEIEAL